MIISVFFAWVLFASGCMSNTDNDSGDSPAPIPGMMDLTKLTPENYQGGEIPQLTLDTPVPDWTWNDPHVIKDGSQYRMYASATDAFDFPVRIYRLTSPDGENWTLDPSQAVLTDSNTGEWDAGGLETPAVVYFESQYHLFYTGYQYEIDDPDFSVYDFRIGHAVSDNGINFTRGDINPIVFPSQTDSYPDNDWYAFIVAEPAPVIFNDELYLYFTAVGADADLGAALQVVGLVRSSDGVNWSEPELVLKPDQTLYPITEDWIGYSTPNAIVLEDQMHLFFDVAHQPDGGDWLQLRLHHAYSLDGKSRWVHDDSAIANAGDFDWAVDEIRSPHAILEGSSLRLYFAGHELDGISPEHFAVGMMTCDLSVP